MAHTDTMSDTAYGAPLSMAGVAPERRSAIFKRSLIIALIAFFTLIDLFGSQALLPILVEKYDVSRAAMGFAVNASTIGMAIAGVLVALFSRRMNRKLLIWLSLALLAIPTFLLGLTEDLTTFALLRVVQGFFMSTAFALTLTWLSEVCTITAASSAMAAYITGNVASNLFGRLLASGSADAFGLSGSFYTFAVLNLTGAAVALFYIGFRDTPDASKPKDTGSVLAAWGEHFASPQLRASFIIGFIVLFAFVGTFTYVNFVLVSERFAVPTQYLGLVYFVFVPAIFTTPTAGSLSRKFGARRVYWLGVTISVAGLALLLTPNLILVLIGLTFVGTGLFCVQAITTGFVGRTAKHDVAAANGLYLTSYYIGGLVGAFAMGQIFDRVGWSLVVIVLIASLIVAGWLGRMMKD